MANFTLARARYRSTPTDLPVGAVVGISFVTGAYTAPASGVVDSSGFMLADGASVPAGNAVTGSVPNLTSGVFLRGSGSSGTGGASSVSLSTSNMPSHSHGLGSHTHNVYHDHAAKNTDPPVTGATDHQHSGSSGSSFPVNGPGNPYGFSAFVTANSVNANVAMNHVVGYGNVNSHVHAFNISGTTVTSGGPNSSNTDSSGSGTSFDILPPYVQVKYLIRVN